MMKSQLIALLLLSMFISSVSYANTVMLESTKKTEDCEYVQSLVLDQTNELFWNTSKVCEGQIVRYDQVMFSSNAVRTWFYVLKKAIDMQGQESELFRWENAVVHISQNKDGQPVFQLSAKDEKSTDLILELDVESSHDNAPSVESLLTNLVRQYKINADSA